jgi:hypothetical protein
MVKPDYMKRCCRCIDIAGKLMLAWFVVCTVRYFYGGRFSEQLNHVPPMFRDGDYAWLAYTLVQIPVASVGILILIPLLLKGRVWGLVVGLLYLVMGYHVNPLWFIVPRQLQVGPGGEVTPLLFAINEGYAVLTSLLLPALYFCRRALLKTEQTGVADDNKSK